MVNTMFSGSIGCQFLHSIVVKSRKSKAHFSLVNLTTRFSMSYDVTFARFLYEVSQV